MRVCVRFDAHVVHAFFYFVCVYLHLIAEDYVCPHLSPLLPAAASLLC